MQRSSSEMNHVNSATRSSSDMALSAARGSLGSGRGIGLAMVRAGGAGGEAGAAIAGDGMGVAKLAGATAGGASSFSAAKGAGESGGAAMVTGPG
jgi:hypothetical protein